MLLRELCRLEKRFVVFLGFQTDGQFVEPRGVESPAGRDQRRLPVREARRPGKASGLGDSAPVALSVHQSLSLRDKRVRVTFLVLFLFRPRRCL